MPKCIECGLEASRLQWTHFKYNCTGKFNNGKEYMAAYPGAKVVDSELAARTSITLDRQIEKYGEKEGTRRFEEYKKKQSISNTFEYKQEKHGWTKTQFDDYNQSRSVTLDNLITRHGDIEGARKWQDYCERQAYTNTLNYFVEKLGKEEGTAKYLEVNLGKKTAHDPNALSAKLGITVDAAIKIISSRFSSNWVSELEKEFVAQLEHELGFELEYSHKQGQYGKWCHALDKYVFYDIVHNNKVIEFNGDYWHASPDKYKATDNIRGRLVSDIWDHDNKKNSVLQSLGYDVKIVWEHEFRQNNNLIKEIAEWMQNDNELKK